MYALISLRIKEKRPPVHKVVSRDLLKQYTGKPIQDESFYREMKKRTFYNVFGKDKQALSHLSIHKSFENLVKNLKVNMNAVIICEYFLSVKLIHKRLKYKKKILRPLLHFLYDCSL